MATAAVPVTVHGVDRRSTMTSSISLHLLDNGLRVVIDEMAVASSAIGFWVHTGSRDEPEALAGASHFLEHLLFKGTEERSAASIAEAFDAVGGDCNAFTTKEYTAFYARLLAEDAGLAVDILSDILSTPALRPIDVDAERQVISEELAMHGDEPADLSAELSSALLYPGSGLGRDTLGTKATIASLTATDIRQFFNDHYGASNLVVAIAGGGAKEPLLERLNSFVPAPRSLAPDRSAPEEPSTNLSVKRLPTEQVHLTMGWRSVDRQSPQRVVAGLYNHLLGGGLSSRLFQRIREREGLAYSVWSEREIYDHAGSLNIMAGTSPDRASQVVEICFEEVLQLAASGPTPRELAVAKGNLRAELLLSLEDSGARMHFAATEVLRYGRVRPIGELLQELDSVTSTEIAEFATTLHPDAAVVAAVGPVSKKSFAQVLPSTKVRVPS